QEMLRLLAYQQKGPEQQLAEQEQEGAPGRKWGLPEMKDDQWQVSYVKIPAKNGQHVICTYGELNTLADMFGTIADMQDTEATVIIQMLQGIRQRVYRFLAKVKEEIGGTGSYQVVMGLPWTSFEGQKGFSGKEKGLIGKAGAAMDYEDITKEQGEFTVANATA